MKLNWVSKKSNFWEVRCIRDWSYAGDIAKGIYQLTTSGKFNNYVRVWYWDEH